MDEEGSHYSFLCIGATLEPSPPLICGPEVCTVSAICPSLVSDILRTDFQSLLLTSSVPQLDPALQWLCFISLGIPVLVDSAADLLPLFGSLTQPHHQEFTFTIAVFYSLSRFFVTLRV